MKKALALIMLLLLLPLFTGCSDPPSPEDMLSDFISAYPAEGIVYSPSRREGEDGYLTRELIEKIYVIEGDLPESYAIFLNSHPTYGAECGVFICESEDERERVTDMCEERLALFGIRNEDAVLIRSGGTVFYSTLSDPERAEKLWREVLRSHQ